MNTDLWGHALTTDSADGAHALGRAMMAFLDFRTDVMAHVDAALAADPDFALPYAVRGILTTTMRRARLRGDAEALLARARAARPPETEREERYLRALEAAIRLDVTAAAAEYEAITAAHPHDLFAQRLAQLELFWIGEVEWMRDISERAAPHWSPDVPGFSQFLGIRAFGLEETGDYARAEDCGRRSVALDPSDSWGAHAVAHVLLMQGRLDDGIGFLSDMSAHWGDANHIRHHNWWHMALFQIDRRDYDAALEIYDTRLRDLDSPLMKAIPDLYIDIQNDVGLLQRLELRGVDVGERWQPIAELARPRQGDHTNPFTNANCALALAAAGRVDEACDCARHMRDFIAADGGPMAARFALSALPAAEAAIAFREGDHARVIEVMTPARRNLWQMGGSHAQRDVFHQIYAESARREGRRDLLAILLDELRAIGLDHLAERSSYADAVAAVR